MAPVLGSGCDPACINLVAGFIEVSGFLGDVYFPS